MSRLTEPNIAVSVGRAVPTKPASSITLRSVAVAALSIVALSLADPYLDWGMHTWEVGSGMCMLVTRSCRSMPKAAATSISPLPHSSRE